MSVAYLVNADYNHRRNANYELRDKINELFEPVEIPLIGMNGNVAAEFAVNKETLTGKFGRIPWGDPAAKEVEYLYRAIPSCLLLYRLICTFGPTKLNCRGNEGYKMVWEYPLKHKETGEFVVFDEWKGGSTFHTRFYSTEDLPESYKNDLTTLINYLISNECAHPYDGVVAGSVA